MDQLKTLDQRTVTSCPGLAFFNGHFFDVFHICAGLRQHVMEVVSDALEWESFLKEFTDAGGTEQEDAEDDVVFLSGIDEPLRRIVQFG